MVQPIKKKHTFAHNFMEIYEKPELKYILNTHFKYIIVCLHQKIFKY